MIKSHLQAEPILILFCSSHERLSKRTSVKSGTSSGGGTICGVLLDSVIHSGHIAAIHADRAGCSQCREFVLKFKSDLKEITGSKTMVEGSDEYYNDRVRTRLNYRLCVCVCVCV